MKTPADSIRKLRIERSWSQEQLALVSGLSLRTIQRIENGRVASLESRKALAAAFDLTPQEIGFHPQQGDGRTLGMTPLFEEGQFEDHPAPSSGLMWILVLSIVFWMGAIPVAIRMAGSGSGWAATVLLGAAVFCLIVLGFSVWLFESTYYRLDAEGLTVKWGPSVRRYRWEEFRTLHWRKGVFTLKFPSPLVTPCVRFSNVVALERRQSRWPLNLTPNDPKLFIEKIEILAPHLTREMVR